MTSLKTIAAASVLMALAGCSTSPVITGAAVGTGAGALAGQAIGGNTRSTGIGAGAGMLLGAVVGTAAASSQGSDYCRYRRADGTVYVARC